MLRPLPQENFASVKPKRAQNPAKQKSSNNSYKHEKKKLMDVSHRLKILGRSPDKFPMKQLKTLIDDTKSILYTIRRIELNVKLKNRNKKKK